MLQRKSREQTGLSIVPRDEQPPEQKGPSPTTPAVEPTERKAQPESQAAPPRDTKSARGLKAYRKPLMAGAAVVALAAAGWFGFEYVTVGRFVVSTDDAYVRANNTTLGAKVSGYVESLPIEDNTRVRAGEVIARIDDGDYRLAVDSAREKVTTQQATVERFDRQIEAQQAAVEQAKAQLVSAKAEQARTLSDYDRQ